MDRARRFGSLKVKRVVSRGLTAALCLGTTWAGVRLSAGAAAPVNTARPVGDPDAHMLASQCAQCHATEAGLSHPVDIVPSMVLPAGWPLEAGRFTCITCHVDTIGEHAVVKGALLRGSATGAAFCAQCHSSTANTRQSQHPRAITQAHLLPTSDATTLKPAPAGDGVNACLACHDGAVAPDAYGGLGATIGTGAPRSHPVGMAYPTTLHIGDAAFKATTLIDRRVRLTGGQVTCNACHSLYSPLPRLMVMRNDRSVLCLNCHAR